MCWFCGVAVNAYEEVIVVFRFSTLVFGLLANVAVFAAPIYPDSNYLFGGSEGDGPSGQSLVLRLADGSAYTASTHRAPIGSESYAENFGWWSDRLGHIPGNYNYLAGYNGVFDSVFRNFFSFDLSGLDGVVTSATLVLRPYSASFPFAPMRFNVFDVSTSPFDLLSGSAVAPDIFDDLGSGKLYGSHVFDADPSISNAVAIRLWSSAVSDINARQGQYFSVGGTVGRIPEPSIIALVLPALGLALSLSRRSKRDPSRLA
ncbi:MAG: hypothetical protein JZU45_17760 [Methyloversatilis discipulorum]|jgi:hypothetical protein|nr:hypothetical protein [Methyloversatilis discipulorum]